MTKTKSLKMPINQFKQFSKGQNKITVKKAIISEEKYQKSQLG